VILDTNLWSYIGDHGEGDALRLLLEQMRFTVLLPPSILLELLRNPHNDSRRRHIAALLAARGRRLASEAELCADDFVKMVRRRRPTWMRSIADMSTIDKYHRMWTRDVWKFAANSPDESHEWMVAGYDPASEILAGQKQNRQAMLADNFASDYIHLQRSGSPEAAHFHLPGWNGQTTDAWRFDIASRYWFDMTTSRGRPGYTGMVQTNRDWIGSRLDMRLATSDPADFTRLWFDEVDAEEVPRDWVRCALAYTQLTMKISHGNARDEQHSAYLTDADIFLTADKRFADALREVRRQAPFGLAETHVVPAEQDGGSPLGAIAAILSAAA